MRNFIVALQVGTMAVLTVMFIRDGLWPYAMAQACYAVATLALFAGGPS